MPLVTIHRGNLTAQIDTLGAELVLLRDVKGRDYLWNGDPAFWKGRAPLLFPMVGRAKNDRIIVDGQFYPMRQHGFARTSPFQVTDAREDRCVMILASSDATLASYPFRFRLDVSYTLSGDELTITATVRNEDQKELPVSFGFHPAFRWPLPGASSKAGHALTFDDPEPEPIRRLADGLLTEDRIATPIVNRTLALDEALFAHDALVFDRLSSHKVTYTGPSRQQVRVSFPEMPFLGVWSKPGAGFVCIEPWQGYASPVDFDGEFAHRPGVVLLPPETHRVFQIAVTIADVNAR